jgi:hypothetical protein
VTITRAHRLQFSMISHYLTGLIDQGFALTLVAEPPAPSDVIAERVVR